MPAGPLGRSAKPVYHGDWSFARCAPIVGAGRIDDTGQALSGRRRRSRSGAREAMIETADGSAADAGRDGRRRAPGDGLVGRDAELKAILGRIRQSQGDSRIVLVLGEEGIGRTRLLRAVAEQAAGEGVQVLSTQCWIAEKHVPFATLRRLLAGSTGEASHGSAQTPHRIRSVAAARALLSRMNGPHCTLIVVDDVQDGDQSSLTALCWLARHSSDHRVSVLFAARGDAVPPCLPSQTEILRLGPVGPRWAATLLDAQPGAPAGRRRLETLQQAAGNPAALLELCRGEEPADNRASAAAVLSDHARVGSGLRERIRRLPPQTRRALLYAAIAVPGEDISAVMAALGTDDLGVWAPAEAAGVITVVDGLIVFRHPLGRSVAASRQPVSDLHQAHRELAAAGLDGSASQAWHTAAATLGTDNRVARKLGEAAWDGGDGFAAGRALERAAGLAVGADRAILLAEALTAAAAVGDWDWVRALHEDFVRCNDDPVLGCAAACAVAATLSAASHQKEAFDLLLDASDNCPEMDSRLALAVAAVASGIADQSGLPEHHERIPKMLARAEAAGNTRRTGQRMMRPLESSQAQSALTAYVMAVAQHSLATAILRRLDQPRFAAMTDPPDRVVRRLAVGSTAYYADEPDTCLEQFRRADEHLRARSAFGMRAWLLAPMVDTLLATGRWIEASAVAESAEDEAAVIGASRVAGDMRALSATLRALRGQTVSDDACSAEDTGHVAAIDENGATRARLARARATAATAQADWGGAFRWLRSLFTLEGEPAHPHLSPRAVAELAVAAVRTGRQQEAAEILERVRAQLDRRPTTRMTLLMHHAAALVDPAVDPEQSFQLALVNPAGEQWPLERAQTRLSYALWLRRCRRVCEAREQLAAALETAEQLGAAALIDAIRGELRASGVAMAPDAEPVAALSGLTAQQRQIVQLAAGGLSNREIGEQLYLSPRTVGSHLYNVYPKLGISSRHQLRDLLEAR